MENKYYNLSFYELVKLEGLSVRTQSICKYYGLLDLKNILEYYELENHSFINLRNCGSKTNNELISLCKKYENFSIVLPKPIVKPEEHPIKKKIFQLTDSQVSTINKFIVLRSKELSIRSYRALNEYLHSSFTLQGISPLLKNSSFLLKGIRNIGKKSLKEMDVYFENIKVQIDLLLCSSNLPEKEL